ncbi:MAG TPA: hypothetical protein VGI12_19840 [Vicinamibacterales bacterium]
MIHTFDPERFRAFEQLMTRALPPDLPHGGQIHRWDGDPDRRTTRLPKILMGWLQRRYLEQDVEEPLASRARTFKRARRPVRLPIPALRLLQKTSTG